MASRVELFDVTIPAGTLEAAPQVTALDFDPGTVERIEVLVPPGPSGLMGFQFRHSGEGVWPRENDRWIISDNEPIKWDVENAPHTRGWALRAYNTDVFAHTVYIRLLVRENVRAQTTQPLTLPIEQPNQPAPQAESPTPDLEYVDSGVT